MIAILKYNSGNIMSVSVALRRLGQEAVITSDPEMIAAADKVIIPGVGEAKSAMNFLRERNLDACIRELKQPVLGICLGLQLLCSYSEENDTECIGVFDTAVKRFPRGSRVPHMGWNDFVSIDGDLLLKGLNSTDNLYYVHSYYAGINESTTAVCEYLVPFSASMHKDNFYGVQFHPEKSAGQGLTVLKNFVEL